MAAAVSSRCRDVDGVHEPEIKVETSESFNPDILHVFMHDADGSTPSIFSPPATKTCPPTATTSFPQFPYLPTELRYLIWEAAAPESTVVPRTWERFGYNLQRKVPPILQACSESRAHLIAESGRSRRSETPRYQLVQTHGRKDKGVYMDWQADSIWIYRGYDIHEAEVAAYAGLESLVMNWGLRPCWVESALGQGVKFIQQFPRLRLFTLLVDFSEHGWPEPSTLKGLKRLKRTEVKRIWALVRKAFKEAQEADPRWSPPSLHIAHRTASWSRQEVR